MTSQADKNIKIGSNKPKLLFVITQGVWGGAQKYVFSHAKALCGEFDVHVAIGEPSGKKDLQKAILRFNETSPGTISLISLMHLRRSISPIHDMAAIVELRSLMKALCPDVVHLNSSKAGVIGSLALPKKQRAMYTVHGWVFNEPRNPHINSLFRFLEKKAAKRRAKRGGTTILLSDQDKKMGNAILGNTPAAIIPIGIDPIDFHSREDARRVLFETLPKELAPTKLIGCVANFYNTKGLDTLIAAAAMVPDATFVVIGEGPERKTLESLISANSLSNRFFLTGAIPDAATLMKAFDIAVIPSRKEGLPFTLLEWMSAEVPVIATDVGGIASVIGNGVTGVLIAPEDASVLASAINAHKQTTSVTDRAKDVATSYTSEKTIAKFRRLVDSLRQL
ncbi:MAG: glycosyltransferase [Candidatus Magasanikbacteria bacterium]|jgi:glycosyltransferase involved in cell wall biosynthesis|nr:glycosyltransferase [Candidatus Magasanikbacteria bacterium]